MFLAEAYELTVTAELDRRRAVTTWGEARDLANETRPLLAPFVVEDLEADDDGDAPFVAAELGAAADGDWPSALAAPRLESAQRNWTKQGDFRVGTEVKTVFNEPVLVSSPAQKKTLRVAR